MNANDFVASVLRGPLHGLLDSETMLITITGRKSGKSITMPVNYVREGDTLWVTSTRERKWWRNLRGGAPATLLLKGKEVAARSEAIEAEAQVAAGFIHHLQLRPGNAKMLGVKLSADGKPFAGMDELVKRRLLVKFTLT